MRCPGPEPPSSPTRRRSGQRLATRQAALPQPLRVPPLPHFPRLHRVADAPRLRSSMSLDNRFPTAPDRHRPPWVRSPRRREFVHPAAQRPPRPCRAPPYRPQLAELPQSARSPPAPARHPRLHHRAPVRPPAADRPHLPPQRRSVADPCVLASAGLLLAWSWRVSLAKPPLICSNAQPLLNFQS